MRLLDGLGMFAPYPDTPCFTAFQVDDSRGVFQFQQSTLHFAERPRNSEHTYRTSIFDGQYASLVMELPVVRGCPRLIDGHPWRSKFEWPYPVQPFECS
jgi:hypothetical protein